MFVTYEALWTMYPGTFNHGSISLQNVVNCIALLGILVLDLYPFYSLTSDPIRAHNQTGWWQRQRPLTLWFHYWETTQLLQKSSVYRPPCSFY